MSLLQAVVFDFDGVITDSEPRHLKAFQDVLGEIGWRLSAEDYYSRYLGFDDVGVFRAVARDQRVPLDDALLAALVGRKSARYESLLRDGPSLFLGAADCVRRCARAVPLAVASGALRHEIELILDAARLRDCFDVIVGAEDAGRSKPAPDPYLRALEELQRARPDPDRRHISASGTVAIEDSRWGIDSAHAAGLRCIAVPHTYRADELATADRVVANLEELTVALLEDVCRTADT